MKNKSIEEIKKMLGINPVIHNNIIHPQRDGSKLYYVMGYTLPLKWQTIEKNGITHDRIIEEVDRAQWQKEHHDQRAKEAGQQRRTIENNEDKPFKKWNIQIKQTVRQNHQEVAI